jgi:hypothetical protein
MIFNLFSYPSNFGKINIYKCDFYGNQLSVPRQCLADNFTVDVEEKNSDDILTFGNSNQSRSFFLGNRKIKISANFLFTNDLSGTLNPAIDLLFNLSAWSYQGTNIPYKFTMTGSAVNEINTYNALFNQSPLPNYKIYVVSETSSQLVNSFPTSLSNGYWIEVYLYGSTSGTAYSLQLEPMFRMDTSEGSFYSCLVDRITINMNEDFVKLSCEIYAINYDRSTRYNFINSSQQKFVFPAIKALHKSRIKIIDYQNDITSNFNLIDISDLEYMNGLITQKFSAVPIKEFSINIDNGLQAYYNNKYNNLKRTYVAGYYAGVRKINGNMKVLSLRSNQPTFDRYPVLSGVSGKSCSIVFGNQSFSIPYTVWRPGKVESQSDNFVTMSFEWEAIARERQGQPLFDMVGGLI